MPIASDNHEQFSVIATDHFIRRQCHSLGLPKIPTHNVSLTSHYSVGTQWIITPMEANFPLLSLT